jgi:hypothetical protein
MNPEIVKSEMVVLIGREKIDMADADVTRLNVVGYC